MKYRIGSFNVKGLSFATNKLEADNEPGQRKDYTTLGSIIRDNFHIVALQEVLNENVLPLLSELDSYKKSLIYEYVTGKKEVPA